jgi:hypothetical protein
MHPADYSVAAREKATATVQDRQVVKEKDIPAPPMVGVVSIRALQKSDHIRDQEATLGRCPSGHRDGQSARAARVAARYSCPVDRSVTMSGCVTEAARSGALYASEAPNQARCCSADARRKAEVVLTTVVSPPRSGVTAQARTTYRGVRAPSAPSQWSGTEPRVNRNGAASPKSVISTIRLPR